MLTTKNQPDNNICLVINFPVAKYLVKIPCYITMPIILKYCSLLTVYSSAPKINRKTLATKLTIFGISCKYRNGYAPTLYVSHSRCLPLLMSPTLYVSHSRCLPLLTSPTLDVSHCRCRPLVSGTKNYANMSHRHFPFCPNRSQHQPT